jgi:hypothetical protein
MKDVRFKHRNDNEISLQETQLAPVSIMEKTGACATVFPEMRIQDLYIEVTPEIAV